MAEVKLLQNSWRGMNQDLPRNLLPKDIAYNLQDWIPNLGAALRKRGGWSYASPALSATATGATFALSVAVPNFTAGKQLIAITDNGKFVKITSPSVQTLISTSSNTPTTPLVMFDDLLIVPHISGATAPQKYNGSALSTLGGTPPNGVGAIVYKNRLWIYHSAANPNRLWGSDIGDPETWDTTNGWQDFSYPITGAAALPNSMLIFMTDRTARVRGTNPPPGGDLTVDDPLFSYGCTDSRSVAVSGPYCIFANPTGVYVTSGTNVPEDLTKSCGIKNLWQSSALTGYGLIGGWYRNLYWITIMNATTFVDSFVFDPVERVAWRNTNIKPASFARDVAGTEELYFGSVVEDRVVSLSSLYSPAAGVKNDGDGTAVTPVFETPYFWDQNSGKKTWKHFYAHYDIRDAASDDPTLTVSALSDPSGAYSALSPTLAETTAYQYKRAQIGSAGTHAHGMAFKVAQTHASSDTRLAAVSAELHAREPSRTDG